MTLDFRTQSRTFCLVFRDQSHCAIGSQAELHGVQSDHNNLPFFVDHAFSRVLQGSTPSGDKLSYILPCLQRSTPSCDRGQAELHLVLFCRGPHHCTVRGRADLHFALFSGIHAVGGPSWAKFIGFSLGIHAIVRSGAKLSYMVYNLSQSKVEQNCPFPTDALSFMGTADRAITLHKSGDVSAHCSLI